MKIHMVPQDDPDGQKNGIGQVVKYYHKYLPEFGVEFVSDFEGDYDLLVVHAGMTSRERHDVPIVAHNHGLYWSADYQAHLWEYKANRNVVRSLRMAKEITVPSEWVAEVFRRDMRIYPTVIGHGIEFEEWQNHEESLGYVLWNKNRDTDVCDPKWIRPLADRFPHIQFVTTFAPPESPPNVQVIGLQNHADMKRIIQRAGIYLSTTKETFGIGVLEALASGVPVLGFRHGGNLETIVDGANGYLAKVDNIDDLAQGLEYCLKYRSILAYNARASAKRWGWRDRVGEVYKVYKKALEPDPATASIIIPSYNYGTPEVLGRAIQSCLNQTYNLLESIIVVDDGSTEGDASAVVASFDDQRLVYVWQENAGVANARNRGIEESNSKYISCLDADDAIEPTFLEECVKALESDRSLGIAYTGLRYIKENGQTGISQWPGEFNFDRQLDRGNQIPTCCVFKRDMWKRLGGYKQRYSPGGAGAEDAELWLRAGAYGWDARQVTPAGLFVYSLGTGRVSGSRDYREVDWTAWHPWTKDHQHPFASVATPKNFSHPVREYDSPYVSVVIPVGPKHMKVVRDALDSLEAQTFRDWEAIVVFDFQPDNDEYDALITAYPYIRVGGLHTGQSKGAGWARNVGVDMARAPILSFLDADDWLYPEALDKMLRAFNFTNSAVYSDYVGKAFISAQMANELGDRLLYYNEKDGDAVILHKSLDFDCAMAQNQPDENLYIWSLVTVLFPKRWHDEIGGFDESMASWEDWDYWIRMALAKKCFSRIPEPLVVYRFYTGVRREVGLQEYQSLIQYLHGKLKGSEKMGCNCGNKGSNSGAGGIVSGFGLSRQIRRYDAFSEPVTETSMSDNDFVLVEYAHGNKGQHRVIGRGTGKDYGYRGGGDKFYVHVGDITAQPDLFIPEHVAEVVSEPVKPPPPPPKPVDDGYEVIEAERNDALPVEDSFLESNNIQMLPGITAAIAAAFNSVGLFTPRDILNAGEEMLQSVKGVGPARARTIIKYIKEQANQ